jgi:hypothetical protein
VLALDTREPDDRRRDAVAERRVVFTAREDGMAELWALLPAESAAALRAALTTRAEDFQAADRAAQRADPALEVRTADQRRADALVELALGGGPVRARIQVSVALSTLLALDQQPGELTGHGPIPAALARALAYDANGTWRRLLTDPTGQVLDYGRRTYRPPAPLARLIQARDATCRFPGCQRAAERSDLDHITAWADGGPTNPDNLHALCPRHHQLKHDTPWHVRRERDGTTTWTSPTGERHTRPPDPPPRDTTIDQPGDQKPDAA